MQSTDKSLLQVLHLPLYEKNGTFFIERQAYNGLRLSLDHFDSITLCLPLHQNVDPPVDTLPVHEVVGNRLSIVPLPLAWTPITFARTLFPVSRQLARLIDRHTYLHFGIGGLFGDWGGVAALIARRRGRKSAVWTDRVESEVMQFQAQERRGWRKAYRLLAAKLAGIWERFVIRRSELGLFHGMDTFNAFSPLNRNPHLVHNIHVPPQARISPEVLAAKCGRSGAVKIVYGGRVHLEKGFDDWIRVLAIVNEAGHDFSAKWFGSGPQLEEARAEVKRLDLQSRVEFPGPTSDHGELLSHLRDADICLFCHKTPESPRALVEALLSGTPIIGYDSPFPRDLISSHGGGRLSPQNDVAALAANLAELIANRTALGELMKRAALDGYPLVDEEVFRHRSDLIKAYLGPTSHAPANPVHGA